MLSCRDSPALHPASCVMGLLFHRPLVSQASCVAQLLVPNLSLRVKARVWRLAPVCRRQQARDAAGSHVRRTRFCARALQVRFVVEYWSTGYYFIGFTNVYWIASLSLLQARVWGSCSGASGVPRHKTRDRLLREPKDTTAPLARARATDPTIITH